MKKFILILSIALMCYEGSAQNTIPLTGTKDAPIIEIVWGRVSKNCLGIGICHLRSAPISNALNEALTLVGLGDFAVFRFTPEGYNANKRKFVNNAIVLEEDYKLDPVLARQVGLPDGYTIKKGVYKIVYDKKTNTYNCTF